MIDVNYDELFNSGYYDNKKIALSKYLEIHPDNLAWSDDNTLIVLSGEHKGEKYLVVDDDKADELYKKSILNTIYIGLRAFYGATGLNIEYDIDYDSIIDGLKYEFGRGNELATYDTDEIELVDDYYAYRIK